MNELTILERSYYDKINKIAEDIIYHHGDTISTIHNFNESYCDDREILSHVANTIVDMWPDDIIKLIIISPTFLRKTEMYRGVFISVHHLELLWASDKDDIIYVINNSKDKFIEQHNDCYEKIIEDVKDSVEIQAKEFWLEITQ